jgi:hypothetical protein
MLPSCLGLKMEIVCLLFVPLLTIAVLAMVSSSVSKRGDSRLKFHPDAHAHGGLSVFL